MTILNLGAGNKLVKGAVQHDRTKHRPEIDIVWDLNLRPWPWPDNAFDLIVACAVLEHLSITLIESVNECWRIAKPGGVLYLKLPYWNSVNAWRDPTHYWHYDVSTCDIFDPRTKYGHDYAFYTPFKWKIVKAARLNDGKSSFALKMAAIKPLVKLEA